MTEPTPATASSSTLETPQKFHHCVICGFTARSKCAGCQQVWYCLAFAQRLCKIYKNPSSPSTDTYCGLCGKTDNLTRTECCDRAICNDDGDYQAFSYSNISCNRNHRRYTLCAFHHNEEHVGKYWKKCEKCVGGVTFNQDTMITQGTSSYNFKEDEWKDAPELKPTKCGNCQKVVSTATEMHSGGGEHLRCMRCIGT
ncbi:hypothetical protein SBOR_1836 [Sclerotinia borealis F-4128]|uniref:Uncharacterized protein n=1 Tax=Sclerotinia borealis (strain F-4128) TaxID=1432307 RepID=W9CM38_SCLBF|nr:hypothetical protein SBOR_1836 [Sclerotinia borealis F-4128]